VTNGTDGPNGVNTNSMRAQGNIRAIVDGARLLFQICRCFGRRRRHLGVRREPLLTKTMKGREHRWEPLQFTKDFHRINRVRIVCNVIPSSRTDILECPEVWVFICEPNVKSRCVSLELSGNA
jgi:hypothetical protein